MAYYSACYMTDPTAVPRKLIGKSEYTLGAICLVFLTLEFFFFSTNSPPERVIDN